jgi:hypothetical protein
MYNTKRWMIWLGLLAAGAAKGQAMEEVAMNLTLAAPPSDGKVVVQVELENRGNRTVLVPRAVASMNRLLGNVFAVKDVMTGEPVPYVGPMVKRGPLTAADYVALKAGQRHTHVLDIGPAYGFAAGTHTYEVTYTGHYVADPAALAGTGTPGLPLAAPPFTFTMTK